MVRGEKNLLCDPESELRVRGRKNRRAEIINGMGKIILIIIIIIIMIIIIIIIIIIIRTYCSVTCKNRGVYGCLDPSSVLITYIICPPVIVTFIFCPARYG